MCVGCRERAAASDLIRVVAVAGACVPDHDRRLPGRGAHLHPTRECLDRAERQKALPRALRVSGPLDLTAVRHLVSTLHDGMLHDGTGARPGRGDR
jgi:predicted RNA-binding protein YlxR (DUF448 family)